jgi:hypothetical protein
MGNTEDTEKNGRKRRYKVMAKYVTVHTNRAYGGIDVQLLLFITLALNRDR